MTHSTRLSRRVILLALAMMMTLGSLVAIQTPAFSDSDQAVGYWDTGREYEVASVLQVESHEDKIRVYISECGHSYLEFRVRLNRNNWPAGHSTISTRDIECGYYDTYTTFYNVDDNWSYDVTIENICSVCGSQYAEFLSVVS